MTRKPGVILIVLGVLGLAYGGLLWTAKVDLHASARSREVVRRPLPVLPIAGAVALVGGIAILLARR